MDTKICTKCGIEKVLDNFAKSNYHNLGVRNDCKECQNKWHRDHYTINKEKINNKHKTYRENNKDKEVVRHRVYQQNNKPKMRKYIKERRKLDPLFRLGLNVRSSIKSSFKRNNHKKNSKSLILLGCSIEMFKTYIKKKFENWMNWDNYGKYNGQENFGWDLDHIIPICSAKSEEEIIKLNHYTNFQPLCTKMNRHIKRGKYFQ